MDILDIVGINLPCRSCGNDYQVPLRDVLISHALLHEGCPVSQETECPPVFQSRLFERKDVEELQRSWRQLEQRARADGGELVFMAAAPSSEVQPLIRTAGRPKASTPTTQASRPVSGSAGKRSEPAKRRMQRSASSKTKERTKGRSRAHEVFK